MRLFADQVPWKHETDWHLLRVPSKMLQVKEGEDAAGTNAETETALFDRASKI